MVSKRDIRCILFIFQTGYILLARSAFGFLFTGGPLRASINYNHEHRSSKRLTTVVGRFHRTTITYLLSTSTKNGENNNDDDSDVDGEEKSPIELQLEQLQQQLTLIEALEARNLAQIDSFVDEQDQLDSMEPEERALLESKPAVEAQMELLAEQLVQLWMGQKSHDG